MGWLNEIFNGSVNRVTRGHYDGNWNEGHESDHIKGTYDGSDNEDIDHAIALSLSEEDQKKGKAVETDYSLEEDEQLARALQESLNVESPPRHNVPVDNVPSKSIPAREPHPHVFPSSGFRSRC